MKYIGFNYCLKTVFFMRNTFLFVQNLFFLMIIASSNKKNIRKYVDL